MSVRAVLIGATGLVGSLAAKRLYADPGAALTIVARRPAGIDGAVQQVAEPEDWPALIAEAAPETLICAIGTTWRKAGSEAAFVAIDRTLVVRCAEAARAAGASAMVVVSSVGADPESRSFYLRVKGEMERDLRGLAFDRLDILRPGLLRGPRGGERRAKERFAILAAPLTDALLHRGLRKYRSIDARMVARACAALPHAREPGVFVHENDMIAALAR